MSSFEGAHDLILNNCTVNTVGGDGTFNSFTVAVSNADDETLPDRLIDLLGGPLLVNSPIQFIQHMTGLPLPPDFCKKVEKHVLSQKISNLPHASAAYDDYTTQDKRRVACFEGTREALLEEIAKWILTLTGPRLYLLWGIAGVGKSTVAQTVAERADNLRRLGASFFFSRNEVDRKNARMFFTTIAFHLCIFSEDFARAIEEVLLTQRGHAAISKEPLEQLKTLILEPLRNFNHRDLIPIVIVIDALDECDDEDGPTVFIGLNRLIQELPFFKVILTTRPHLHLQVLIDNQDTQTEFHLQNIEDKIVNDDIQRYLEHNLSHEQVQKRLPKLRGHWSASDQDIASLVRAADRLFIVASTAVLFILDKVVRNPASRIKTLQDQFAHNRAPLNALNEFYTVILQSAVPEGCEYDIIRQYQLVVGTAILVEDPLPVEALAALIALPEEAVYSVLDNLQSVISISGKNTPRVYHKSFPDYLTDDTRCKDDNLHIIPRVHHTRIAARCLQLMNEQLKQNILGVKTYRGSTDNGGRLREWNITPEKLMEKIPGDLRYACIYWANHIGRADTENINLAKEVETFVVEHLLHWLEALSWINKIDVAYPAVRVISKYMKPTSSNISGIISDALRFIARFSEDIRRSALYTYYCALPFTPTNGPLYRAYCKETLCRLEGTPTQWDALIATVGPSQIMFDPVFSHDSSKFSMYENRDMILLDAEGGMDLRSYEGDRMAVAHNFSVVAVSNGCATTLWSVKNRAPIATVMSSGQVTRLALSFDGARLAVWLVDGMIWLWDARNTKLMATLEGHVNGDPGQLRFSPRGHRLAFISYDDGTIRLWNGDDGGFVARLEYKLEGHSKFVFSRDGRRLASLTEGRTLTLWDGEKGIFITATRHVGGELAISEDGSFIATGGSQRLVQLWSGNPLALVDTLDGYAHDLAISCGILAIASFDVKLYDINQRAVVVALDLELRPWFLALSPDCTRLLVEYEAESQLYDVALLKASIPMPKRRFKTSVTALTFSPDSSRLASGLEDGTIELWDPNHAERPISTHGLHLKSITTLAFALDGKQFVSGSDDKTIKFWGGNDGAPLDRTFLFSNAPTSAAFSHDLLAVATSGTITLFNYEPLIRLDVLWAGGHSLTFSRGGTRLAWASHDLITVRDIVKRVTITTFTTKSSIHTLTFSPDGSQLAAKIDGHEGYELLNTGSKHSIEPTGIEHHSWIPGVMNGLLVWCAGDFEQYLGSQCLIGQPSRYADWIGVLWIPEDVVIREVEFGLSTIALGCEDGHILFVRFPATSIH